MSERPSKRFALVTLLVLALSFGLLLHAALTDLRIFVAFALLMGVLLAWATIARRRTRELLRSGDVHRVLAAWQRSLERLVYPETMAPLMIATAYASHGFLGAARNALERAVRGPAWEAALEQRLFVETLLHTFEGDRTEAKAKASALAILPLPRAGVFARRRILKLREGMVALVRAFSHEPDAGDRTRLLDAASVSPLIHWAMRYAAAVVAIDSGDGATARAMLEGAPPWPEESAFRSFHEELAQRLT